MPVHVIRARNVNDALGKGLQALAEHGVLQNSRNGRVLRMPGLMVTEFTRPLERVLFSPLRDANPFFHVVEALWMLGGRRDSAVLTPLAKQMGAYEEPGKGWFWGAYGHRWRSWFGYDQLLSVVGELRKNPDSRRCVLQMWDGAKDLQRAQEGGPDVPCNMSCTFSAHNGTLDMTVFNRSNDAVWGAYGANAVHFSFLQEFVATSAGLQVGSMVQVSSNWHAYIDRPDVHRLLECPESGERTVKYQIVQGYPEPTASLYTSAPLITDKSESTAFLFACHQFCNAALAVYRDGNVPALLESWLQAHPFLQGVALPMLQAHAAYKSGDVDQARQLTFKVQADDWSLAAREWIARRATKKEVLA